MSDRYVKTEISGRCGVITVDFPPANALAPEVRDGLDAALSGLMGLEDVWTVLITAAGDKFFMAGANIPSLLDLTPETALERVRAARALLDHVSGGPKPVIAAINGLCLGGGLELALACDIRIAADHARLGLPEVGLGLMPGGGGTQRLPRTIAPGLARYLMYTGETLTAPRALEVGLVERVVPAGELMAEARDLAEQINRRGPLGVRAAKQAVNGALSMPLDQGLEFENRLWAELFATADVKEGVTAFLEKRTPNFQAS